MYTIHLSNLQLNGRHGVYAGEQLLDAPYEVNIVLKHDATGRIEALDDSINYEAVYQLLLQYFNQPYPLLETLAYDLATAINTQFSTVAHISIRIEKLNPLISSIQGRVGVSYEWWR